MIAMVQGRRKELKGIDTGINLGGGHLHRVKMALNMLS